MEIYLYQNHVSLHINQENDIQLSTYQSSTQNHSRIGNQISY